MDTGSGSPHVRGHGHTPGHQVYSTTTLSQFLQRPTRRALGTALKRVLRYLQGHPAGAAGVPADSRQAEGNHSIGTGLLRQRLGQRRQRPPIHHRLGLPAARLRSELAVAQAAHVTALSSVEAEYMAAAAATKEAVWWRRFLTELGLPPPGPTIHPLRQPGQHRVGQEPGFAPIDRTKHIDVRYHFIREQLACSDHQSCVHRHGADAGRRADQATLAEIDTRRWWARWG